MAKVLNISDTESFSDEENETKNVQMADRLGFEMTSRIACSTNIGDDGASSSGTNLRSSFIGMGFSPSLIDKVIAEKGEDDPDALLDTLFAYSVHQKLNSEASDSLDQDQHLTKNQDNGSSLGSLGDCHLDQAALITKSSSSDSLDSLLDDEKDPEVITTSVDIQPKQEADIIDLDDDKRGPLLMMNFSADEVDFAINKLGSNAPINELVDFIIAAQIAKSENVDELPNGYHVKKNEDSNTEALFGTMDKTLQLLKMGFNEHEVSLAIEKLGSGVPMPELANWICASQMGESFPANTKKGRPTFCAGEFTVKAEPGFGYPSLTDIKEEYYDESTSVMRDFNIGDIKGKRPKEEPDDGFYTVHGSLWKKKSRLATGSDSILPSRKSSVNKFGTSSTSNLNSSRGLDKMVSGPPFFLYGNVINLSADDWQKMSQFLYALQPEFVNSQAFSALNRKEGYIHNLPTENRFRIDSKSPMTIEEAMPHTKKCWPSWDTRKQLNFITCDAVGTSQICSSLGKMLRDCRGVLSGEQKAKVLHYCQRLNLVWLGPHQLAPIEPERLERILGYPINHTKNPDMSVGERLQSLMNCFQTDTLGYHLSVLKPLFPGGINVLSLYSGIGGAEVTLHRLGIYLKAVVSVESSEIKRKILRRWWQNTDQSGELVQVEDIQKLTSNKLESFRKRLGDFDLIICQTPCTFPQKGPNKALPGGGSDGPSLDFTMYCEFVRVLQRVRNMTGRA